MGMMHKLAEQARRPSGFFGKLASRVMVRANQEGIEWTIELLDIQPADRVLEIGFRGARYETKREKMRTGICVLADK